ncbi:15960_t:CDS:10 [Funneliformis mosseae]|uniref:15960_t:CDS:1 n=1 Tax=Funneliformis mosseae TaxID=27381 RepID=A0A9N8V298_FUNMO|nr:15960_t:CDS:10 [Funneliformis mosseae]
MGPYTAEFNDLNDDFNEILSDFVVSKDQTHLVFDKKIEKSDNDTRPYRIIILLKNNLEVLIINDVKTEKATASMDINVDYYSDMAMLITAFNLLIMNIETLRQIEIPLREGVLRPHTDIHKLYVYIPIANQIEKAASYVSHLIGHEGAGSICSLLKQRGWITSINVKTIEYSVYLHMLTVSIDLTKGGVGHYEDVLEIIFQMLRRGGPHYEVQSLSWRRFMEISWKSNDTSPLARILHKPYTRDRILSSSNKDYKYDRKLIIELLECLRIENSNISVASKLLSGFDSKGCFDAVHKYQCESSEKSINAKGKCLFDAEYRNEPINVIEELIRSTPIINILENITPKSRPNIISENGIHRVWYAKDDTLSTPKVKIELSLTTPLIKLTPTNLVKTELYLNLFNDSIEDRAYDALFAGLKYNSCVKADFIFVRVSGRNDKALKLLEFVLKGMKNLVIEPDRFKILKKSLMNRYYEMESNPPLTFYDCLLFKEWYFTAEEISSALKDISMEDVQSFFPKLFQQLFIESLVFGNMEEEDMKMMINKVEQILEPRILEKSRMVKCGDISLPQGKKYVYQKNVFENDSTIRYYLQCNDIKDRYVVISLNLIARILRKYFCFFWQIGCEPFLSIGDAGFIIHIKNEGDTIYLENIIEKYLIKVQSFIERMTEKEFQNLKQPLINHLLEKEKNMEDKANLYSNQIFSGFYDFDKYIKDVEELKRSTKDDVLEFYKANIHPKSSKIKKMSLHLRSLRSANANVGIYTLTEDNMIITDIDDFKSKLQFQTL